MYDFVIIGAGPAGSTLARILDRNFKTLIIDKRNLDESSGFTREKCCGGLLAPAAQKALARQGLGVPKDVLEAPQTFSVKSVDNDNGLIRYYQRHYININREKFDRWLLSIVPDNVDKKFGCLFKGFKEYKGFYSVRIEQEGILSDINARFLIGADGASSRVRQIAFKGEPMPTEYVSTQEHFKTKGNLPYYVSYFDSDITDFYSWIIQKNDDLLVGAAIPGKSDVDRNFSKLVDKLRQRGYIEGISTKRTGSLIMRPKNLRQLCIQKGNILLAGEAAGLISPSSAEGISYALDSGRILAESINKKTGSCGRLYNKNLLGMKINLIYKWCKVMLMYNKITRGLIMRAGLFSMEVDGND